MAFKSTEWGDFTQMEAFPRDNSLSGYSGEWVRKAKQGREGLKYQVKSPGLGSRSAEAHFSFLHFLTLTQRQGSLSLSFPL